MAPEQIDVLLIEDDEDDFFITRSLLDKAAGIECMLDWARSFEEGLEALLSGSYDACLVDYRLDGKNGLDLMHAAAEAGCRVPMILLTGQGDLEVDLSAMMAGAADYLVKNKLDAQLLERSIRYARERTRAQQRIREQAALLDKARDAICACDMDGRIIYWNRSAERLTGWTFAEMEALSGPEVQERLLGPTDEGKLKKARHQLLKKGEWTGELRHHTRDSGEHIVESRWTLVRDEAGTPASVLIISTDITERKQLEAQYLRAQRMESIGRLVSGIAHDLGNLLVPVLLGVEVLQSRYPGDEKVQRTLTMIQKSAQRGSDMIKQVLSFARGVKGERTALDLQPIIEEVERITEETFPDIIEVETHLPEDLWKIRGDATQVQQVLVNLCMNARDAMTKGGRLTIEAQNLVLDEGCAQISMNAEAGAYVSISVTDTGQGIKPEHLDKVFEPFFTTKPAGKGTGLGLSTVYSIVRSHDGFADVNSQPGKGTSFSIYLPMAEEEKETPEEEAHLEISGGNGELVLIVDDEDFILETAKDALGRVGYNVLTASSAEEALRLFERYQDRLDAVVADLILPDLSGTALIEKLKAERPGLPVLVTSSPIEGRSDAAFEAGADYFLAKPFTAERLCATLFKAIGEAVGRATPA